MPHRHAATFIEEKTTTFLKKDLQEVIDIHVDYLFQLGWLPARYNSNGAEIGIHIVESNDQYTKFQYGKFLIEFPTHAIQGDNIAAWMGKFVFEIDGKEKIVFSEEVSVTFGGKINSLLEGDKGALRSPVIKNIASLADYYRTKIIIRLYEK